MKSQFNKYFQFENEPEHVTDEEEMPVQVEMVGRGSQPIRQKQVSEIEEEAVVRAKSDLLKESFNSVDEFIAGKSKSTNVLNIFKSPARELIKPAARETLVLRLMQRKGFEREVAQYCLR